MKNFDGGYESGYKSCDCFWGTEPASLLKQLSAEIPEFRGMRVLDVGCGEGKNAAYLSKRGANVVAIDLSARALEHARRDWGSLSGIEWIRADIRDFDLGPKSFDVVVLYGLFHCFETHEQIRAVYSKLEAITEAGGYHVVCCFNSRQQELAAAHPGFHPCLVEHRFYAELYHGWELLRQSDSDLTECHPNNHIRHTHSMTRLLARKRRS